MEEQKETKVIEVERGSWKVPQCCREGWESCVHVAKKQKKIKTNPGL